MVHTSNDFYDVTAGSDVYERSYHNNVRNTNGSAPELTIRRDRNNIKSVHKNNKPRVNVIDYDVPLIRS